MLKRSLALVGALALAGCGTDMFGPNDSARLAAQAPTNAELAAYAGSHKYPTTQPAKDNLKVASIIDPNRGVLKVYNFSNQPIQDGNVWVNQSYVQHIRGIAPGSAPVLIREGDLYNNLGQRFSSQQEHVRTVQIETAGNLYTVMGPGAE